jgi:hypothetical protein
MLKLIKIDDLAHHYPLNSYSIFQNDINEIIKIVVPKNEL